MYGATYNLRKCQDEHCRAEVKHHSQHAGYCSGEVQHWNEPTHHWGRPKCECGSDKVRKESPHASRGHSTWCQAGIWERI